MPRRDSSIQERQLKPKGRGNGRQDKYRTEEPKQPSKAIRRARAQREKEASKKKKKGLCALLCAASGMGKGEPIVFKPGSKCDKVVQTMGLQQAELVSTLQHSHELRPSRPRSRPPLPP